LAPLEELVLSILQRRPSGLTTHELADVLQLSLVTVSPRMRPLVRRGAVIDSGERRKNVSGRASIVWKAVNDPCATRTGRRNDDLERMGTRRGESAS
jgi:predicted ArsR family transcriptional regulator